MKPLKILGVYRDPKFSNNAIEADRLILQESIKKIQGKLGTRAHVDFWEEGELGSRTGMFDLVLTMAQSTDALAAFERDFAGQTIWNSVRAVRNCYRKAMSAALIHRPVNYVPYQLLPTDGSVQGEFIAGETYWLKRSDFHAICDDDVTMAESAAEAEEKIAKFRQRGVKEVLVQRHVQGDIYKFYGVQGGFFRAFKVRSFLPASASAPQLETLEHQAAIAADALGLVIYGGDAILDSHGRFQMIDVNDWPSFRICRDEAAAAIANLATEYLSAKPAAKSAAFASSAPQARA